MSMGVIRWAAVWRPILRRMHPPLEHASLSIVLALTITALVAAAEVSIPAMRIPQQPGALPVPEFIGRAATPQPVSARPIPQHPFMAPNGRSNVHNDAYMSDTYTTGGPLGRAPGVRSTLLGAECASVAFDRAGRLVTVCVSLARERPRLLLLDPVTLATFAIFRLPWAREDTSIAFAGGGYFFLDQQDRVVIPTKDRQIWVVAQVNAPHGLRFELARRYDLSTVVPPDDAIVSTLPDVHGRLWFVTAGGLVGTLDPASGAVATRRLEGEGITNSFAVDETGGVFIVSTHALYRVDAGTAGEPAVTWREAYDRGTRRKPGQVSMGSGTTPTLMGEGFVAITDNADPQMHVLIYRRPPVVQGDRLICAEPVFESGQSATENSLIGTERSLIVTNNYGYTGPEATRFGHTTVPGVTRIDLREDERGCHTLWTSQERVTSVVSKLSLVTGLVYTYTKDPGPATTDAWYFTALDFRSGATVFKRLAGTGRGYNPNYAGLYLGPEGTSYVGVLGGLIAIGDRE
jgi:hypothetical protein